jgi:hypothetical protein
MVEFYLAPVTISLFPDQAEEMRGAAGAAAAGPLEGMPGFARSFNVGG